jgi:hypothetical protein
MVNLISHCLYLSFFNRLPDAVSKQENLFTLFFNFITVFTTEQATSANQYYKI